MNRTKSSFVRVLMSGLFLLCAVGAANAQFNAGIQGTVTDATGGLVSAANVTLTNNETSKSQTITASDEGFYRFSNLAPGTYTLTVEKTGFKKQVFENVVINAEAVQGIDVVLTAGAIDETVIIAESTSQALETENGNISKAVTTLEIQRLPQVGRDPYELLRLTPGVFGSGARSGSGGAVELPGVAGPGGSDSSVFQVENQVQISANGQRVSANNFQIDGVSVNSLGWGGAAVVTPNQESVKEVRVKSSSYSAEDGRNSGAQIEVVSQSGSNDYHGSAVFKYNDPKLNAFNKYGGPGAPPIRVEQRFKQFAGSFGGPIYLPNFGEGGPSWKSLKNRAFFFISYEGLRNNTGNVRNAFVETAEFRQYVQNIRPTSLAARLFNTAGVLPRIIATIPVTCAAIPGRPCQVVPGGLDVGSVSGPLGTRPGDVFDKPEGGGLDGIPDLQFVQAAIPNQLRGNQFNARVDVNHGDNQFAISTYFTRQNSIQADFSSMGRPIGDLTFKPLNVAGTLLWNRVISATMFNEARFNVTRFAFDQVKSSAETNFGVPRIKVEGTGVNDIFIGAPRSDTTPGIFAQNTFEFRDTLSKVVGNHSLKFGAEIRKEQDNNNLVGGARPEYGFFRLWYLANDTPIFEAINIDPRTGSTADIQRYFRTSTYGFFVQNDWKVRPNFTLNLGLRWEYFSPLSEKEGRISNFIFGPAGQELSGGRVQIVDQFYPSDKNNFAPRLGFAWSPGVTNNKLVLRGGFGVSYNRIFNNILANSRANPPFLVRHFVCCAFTPGDTTAISTIFYAFGANNSPFSYPANLALAQGIDPVSGGPRADNAEVYGAPPELPNARVLSYSIEGQYELPHNLIASLGYQGSRSRNLIRTVNQNFLFNPDNPKFFAIYFPMPDVSANYNSLLARISRRFSGGFQIDANYRLAKSEDGVSFEFGGNANQTNPRDLKSEQGPSDFDVRHYLTVSGLWDLPIFRNRRDFIGKAFGGWQINSIVTYHTGFPWTPKMCNDLDGDGQGCFGRPTAYRGGALEPTNDNLIQPGGIFPGGGTAFFDITTPGQPGIGRNSFRGPRYFGVDFSVVKQFGLPFGESSKLDLRANFFNAFNTLNLQQFNYSDEATQIDKGLFGRAERGLAGRVIEFQARFSF